MDLIVIKDKKNVLIVMSYGALMWYLRKVPLSKEFIDPKFTKAKNGYLYTFEN